MIQAKEILNAEASAHEALAIISDFWINFATQGLSISIWSFIYIAASKVQIITFCKMKLQQH